MALEKLKNLVKNNFNPNKEIAEIQADETQNTENKNNKITYENWGFVSAGYSHGRESSFAMMLESVKQRFKKEYLENENATKIIIDNAKNDLTKTELQISLKEKKVEEIKNNKITVLKEKIENLKKDIIRIKENPKELLKDMPGIVSFIIGVLILSALTIYLFVFYSSASYSAFFKEFTIDSNLGTASSIFDPKAIEIAYRDGFTELILILTIPFVFLGLGYLIHKFQEKKNFKNYFKIVGLIAVTFIFDFILAYEITEKIYSIKKEGSFQDMPDYSVALAFQSVNFWLIIFAGFVVYLIWGFVFDFVMESYDKLDIVKQTIKARETEMKLYDEDIHKHQNTVETLNKEINDLKLECKDFEKIISGQTIIIDWNGCDECVYKFTSGWIKYMNARGQWESKINQIHALAEIFVNKEKTGIK